MNIEIFISGFLLSLSLCLDLGIVNVAIIRTGIENGFLKSFNLGVGSSLGDLFYAVLSLLGITLILKFLIVKWILWIAGTSVLLYFCYTMIIQSFKPIIYSSDSLTSNEKNKTDSGFIINGFLLALSSPTAILWFASIGGSIIAAQRLDNRYDVVTFLGGFFAASITWSLGLAYISFKGGQLMKNKIKIIFSILSAIIFLILAIYVFIDGYNTLIK